METFIPLTLTWTLSVAIIQKQGVPVIPSNTLSLLLSEQKIIAYLYFFWGRNHNVSAWRHNQTQQWGVQTDLNSRLNNSGVHAAVHSHKALHRSGSTIDLISLFLQRQPSELMPEVQSEIICHNLASDQLSWWSKPF